MNVDLRGIDDFLWDFDRRWRQGGPIDIARWLADWPDVSTREEITVSLVSIACELQKFDFSWLRRQFDEPYLSQRRETQIQILRLAYLNQVEVGKVPEWRQFEEFNFNAEELDLCGPMDQLSLGQLIDDRFQIIARIGNGAIATVFRAVDLSSQSNVVVKVPRMSEHAGVDFSAYLLEEARTVRQLNIAGIPKLIAAFETEVGIVAVFEFCEGLTLQSLFDVCRVGRGILLRLIAKTARILDELHKQGYVHGDISPSNIIVGGPGEVSLIDFNMSRRDFFRDICDAFPGGNTAFMSPETLWASTQEGNLAEDIYSLGGVLYYGLTGCPPRQAATRAAAIEFMLGCEPVDLSSIEDPYLRRVLETALNVNPLQRFERATDFADACEAIAEGRVEEVDPPPVHTDVDVLRLARYLGELQAWEGSLLLALDAVKPVMERQELPPLFSIQVLLHDQFKSALRLSHFIPRLTELVVLLAGRLGCETPRWSDGDEMLTRLGASNEIYVKDIAFFKEMYAQLEHWHASVLSAVFSRLMELQPRANFELALRIRQAILMPTMMKAWSLSSNASALSPATLERLRAIFGSSEDEAVILNTLKKLESLMDRAVRWNLAPGSFTATLHVAESAGKGGTGETVDPIHGR